MDKDRRTELEIQAHSAFQEVDECLSKAVTLLTNLILEADVMAEHDMRMAQILLGKIEYMREKEMLDIERKREFLRTLRHMLSYHLKRVQFGKFTNPVHTRKLRPGKRVEVIPDDII